MGISKNGKKKLKVVYAGNFSDPEYEGLMTIVNSLKSNVKSANIHLEDGGNDKDLINIHSSGFFESIAFGEKEGIKVYSLHANILPLYFSRLLDYIHWFIFLRTGNSRHQSMVYELKKVMANLISNFTPVFVKRFFLNKMDTVVLPNEWLMKKLKLKNAKLIRHGVDIEKFRHIVSGNHDKVVVSYFGHPDPEKGVLELIDAFSKLHSVEKRMFFTEKNEKLETFVKSKDKSIEVFGFVKNIVREYNDSDIIVLPYRHWLGGIATPLVLIEAMSCEKTVITTDMPHLREICGDSVLYVKPHSATGIVDAVNALVNNPKLRKQLGKKARERIVKYHNLNDMIIGYEKLYKSLIFSSR